MKIPSILVLAALLVAFPASSGTLDVVWSNPTVNVDGTAIPATGPDSLAATRVELGTCVGSDFGVALQAKVEPVPGTTTSFTNVAAGVYCLRAYWANVDGNESMPSATYVHAEVPGTGTITVSMVIS